MLWRWFQRWVNTKAGPGVCVMYAMANVPGFDRLQKVDLIDLRDTESVDLDDGYQLRIIAEAWPTPLLEELESLLRFLEERPSQTVEVRSFRGPRNSRRRAAETK